jgi:predicted dehydrogenase
MGEEAPGIVSICTPDETHLDVLEECVGSPGLKAIWSEKPLGTDLPRAKRLVQACQRKGIVLAVNYQRRWDPQMGRIKKALQNGALGSIQKVVVYYSRGICHNGSHAIDLLLDWFGPARDMRIYGCLYDFSKNDPTVDAHFVSGETPVCLVGTDGREYGLFEIHILGTRGRVNVRNFGRETEWFLRRHEASPGEGGELKPRGQIYRTRQPVAMGFALDDIISAVRTGGRVRSNGESALAVLKVCREMVLQARELEAGPDRRVSWLS